MKKSEMAAVLRTRGAYLTGKDYAEIALRLEQLDKDNAALLEDLSQEAPCEACIYYSPIGMAPPVCSGCNGENFRWRGAK